MTAVSLGNTQILQMLLEGPTGWACPHDASKALCLAAGQGHVVAAEMLLRLRADVNQRQGLGSCAIGSRWKVICKVRPPQMTRMAAKLYDAVLILIAFECF